MKKEVIGLEIIESASKRVAKIREKIEALEAEEEALKPAVMEEMRSIDAVTFPTKFGTFSITEGKVTYKYSPKVKELQDYEVKNGIAEKKIGASFLKFTPGNKQKTDEQL